MWAGGTRLSRRTRGSLELDDDSGLKAEIVLGAIADDQAVAEAGVNEINLGQAEGDAIAEGEVQAAAGDEVEGVVVRQLAEVDAFTLVGAVVVDVLVNIVVGSAEHDFGKWLEAFESEAQDGADGVSEHVPAGRKSAIGLAIAALGVGWHRNILRMTAVVRKFGFEADAMIEEISE